MKQPTLTPEQQKELYKMAQFFEKVADIIRERDQLREQVKTLQVPKSEGYLAEVLHRALNNETGWREEAREALGLYTMLTCQGCGKPFRSGGKRKLNCGGCDGTKQKNR